VSAIVNFKKFGPEDSDASEPGEGYISRQLLGCFRGHGTGTASSVEACPRIISQHCIFRSFRMPPQKASSSSSKVKEDKVRASDFFESCSLFIDHSLTTDLWDEECWFCFRKLI
jgi:hypothetical protein